MAEEKTKEIPAWMNFVIGGASGMMAICVVQPMDLLKTRMQLLGPAGKNTSVATVASNIVKNEGVKGLYKGLSAGLFRQATYTTGRLGCFNALFDVYKAKYGTPELGVKILLGMIAGSVGAFIGTPAEVALIRMTADGRLPPEQRRNYTHVFNALSRIIREEGVRALWRGTGATVSRAIVVNGAQLGSYTQAREMLLPSIGGGFPLHFASAMISGFITTVASLPVDIVKTRVQNAAKGTSQLAVLNNVIRNEGILALWSGLLPTYLKIGPHTVLCFVFLEQLNALYFRLAY
ncbi:mitochondrial 2-oxoglutarate/malate carrier protein-like [Anticarsia gemmatalis]|uniref:mitochondrial 2-oxoglutarate/malate carrier protein-like n=1 Tax=Anticarsia gemmatalis TaxID=129554 RepID=UPI003F76AF1B